MGNGVGVFTDEELEDLNENEHKMLRNFTFVQLLASKEVRDIVEKNPLLVTKIPEINKVLRDHLSPMLNRMKQ